MTTLFVRHKVNDYDQWKRVYDGFAGTRHEWGVTGASVHRDVEDPDTVIVTHQFADSAAAQRFVEADELRGAMAEAGVAGPPEIWIAEDVEQTEY